MSGSGYRSWVEISRGALAANYRQIRQLVGEQIELVPVVKADAYRHGAVEVARVLAAEGAGWLAVSSVEEGVQLRQGGFSGRILVLSDFLPANREALLANRMTPSLHALADVAAYDELCRQLGEVRPYHLKIDSGMGRLGTRASAHDIVTVIDAARACHCEGLLTHFASSSDYRSPQTGEQMARFEQLRAALGRAGITPRYIHLSSSNPLAFGRSAAWGNMVRPGMLLYGYTAAARGDAPPVQLQVSPVLTWKARVIQVQSLPAGAPVGYGAMYVAKQPIQVAVLAAGYADGVPHRTGNKGCVLVNGRCAPIIGAVSMDLTTVDVTHAGQVAPGDAVTLLGRDGEASVDAQQIARLAGTISYAVLCGISARVKRVYVD